MNTQDLFDKIIAKHHSYYADEPDGMLRPMIIFEAATGKIEVVPVSFDGEEEKQMLCHRLRLMFSLLDVQRYVFFSESWAASYKDMNEVHNGLMPSERPDRVEVIMTVAADKTGTKIGSTLELVRNPESELVTSLRPYEIDATSFTGRFAELLG